MKLLRRILLVTGLLLLVLVCIGIGQQKPLQSPTATAVPVAKVVPELTSSDIPALATLINKDRTDAGLPPLVEDTRLDTAAQEHCTAQLAANVWSHNLPDGRTPYNFIQEYIHSWKAAGENNSYGWPSVEGVNKGWMGSPEHEENIMNPTFTNVGYAVCQASNYTAPGLEDVKGSLIIQNFVAL